MRRGVRIIGTLGVLERASERGLIADLAASVERLRGTNFRAPEWLYQRVLRGGRERKQGGGETREGPTDAGS
jgi:predicted nucleic acid-binding protein